MISVRVRRKPDREYLQLWYRCPLTGRIVTRSAETADWREAERAAALWESKLAATVVDNPSWDAFRIRFENEFLAQKPPNTRLSYHGALNNWERHVGKVRALSLITPSVVSRFAAEFGKKVAQTTVASNLRHIRAALRWAESMEMIRRAPRIVVPKTGRRRLARSRAITREEFEAMRSVVPQVVSPDDKARRYQRLLDLLWVSGLRVSEAIALSWTDPPILVDLDRGPYPRLLIHSEGQKSRSDETCVIAPDFATWLAETPATERVGSVVGLSIKRVRACHVISACGEKAGVKTGPNQYAGAHDIRRAFAQRWAVKVKPLTLQKMLRHASIATTLSYYVDLADDDVGGDLWGESVPRRVPHLGSDPSGGQKKTPKKRGKKQVND